MPYDSEGNLTTTVSVNVPTIQDKIRNNEVDVIPLFLGGMATVSKDAKNGDGVYLKSNTTPMP